MRNFEFRNHILPLGGRAYVMGILNVTPDSFSDGGKYFSPSDALEHALRMAEEGADIIDVGAVSTRPGGVRTDTEEEWRRLSSVLPVLRREISLPISVDTFREEIAEKCLDAGADILNDVSGLYRQSVARIVKKYDAGWILMHSGVLVCETAAEREYPIGVVNDVQGFYDEAAVAAAADGIDVGRLCFDPGFGFGKNVAQNAELLRNFDLLDPNGAAQLCALSRKRFIAALSDDASAERLGGTLAADVLAVTKGADILRVHDVALHRKAVEMLGGLDV